MENLEQKLKKRVEAGELSMPALPTTAIKVVELTRSEDSDAQSLAKLIQTDQTLASQVMKVANSAAFNSVGQIQTLQQAIAKLGMQQISQMVLAVSVGQTVFGADAYTETLTSYLWRHSLASATWAREIARLSKINTEVVFLCGLLHQIGKPVALHALMELADDEEYSLVDMLALVDQYQRVIGVSLARRWNLPEPVVESINYIDDFYAAPSAREEVMAVNAARLLADLRFGVRFDSPQSAIEDMNLVESMRDEAVFVELNFYDEDLQMLQDKVEMVESTIQAMLV